MTELQCWPFETGPLLAALWDCGGLHVGENHMVLVSRTSRFEKQAGWLLDIFMQQHGEGRRRGKTTISQLMPGCGTRGIHTDTGGAAYDDGACDRRYHVPLQTNDDAVFQVKDQLHRMPMGFVYLVNPLVPHRVMNGGTTPRIHLFFNAIEQKEP